MNCGACHTSEVSCQSKQVLIGGGAAHLDSWSFISALDGALLETWEDWAFRNATHIVPGPGRVDALNVILNQVTA